MKPFNGVCYPPTEPWDPRLTEIQCNGLAPVQTLHENEWFAIRNRGGYYTMEYHLPHVIVLPVVSPSSMVLIRVKRPVVNDDPWELPAGSVEEGESPQKGAARELGEETGIVIEDGSRFVPMPPLSVSPNR